MEARIEFILVWAKCAMTIKEVLDQAPRHAECINYIDVLNKMTRTDYMQAEPSDAVVSSHLMRQLNSALSRSTTKTIYYVVSSTDSETLSGIMQYVQETSKRPIEWRVMVPEGHAITTDQIQIINF